MKVLGKRLLVLLTCFYGLLLTVVSLLPSGQSRLGGWDSSLSPTLQNALHVPIYAVLVALGGLCLRTPRGPGLLGMAGIAILCFAFGTLLEIAQTLVPGRTGSLTDLLLNAVGVLAGGAVIIRMSPRNRPKEEQ